MGDVDSKPETIGGVRKVRSSDCYAVEDDEGAAWGWFEDDYPSHSKFAKGRQLGPKK